MTRKDFEILARIFGVCMKAGELGSGPMGYIAAQLDRDYPNFNRDAFEAAVRKAAGAIPDAGD